MVELGVKNYSPKATKKAPTEMQYSINIVVFLISGLAQAISIKTRKKEKKIELYYQI